MALLLLLSQEGTEKDNSSLEGHIRRWKDQEDGRLVSLSFEYLDTASLIQKKSVCKNWQQFCTKSINDKCGDASTGGGNKQVFKSKNELREAVNKYSPGICFENRQCSAIQAEEIASIYGYPINTWDVSNVTNFSEIFLLKHKFNEPIGSWDVSNGTDMRAMFSCARSFNQDISSWDVSNVTSMRGMFFNAYSFNQDISSWDVSKVTDMACMFARAESFNQDLSSWDVANVLDFDSMFYYSAVEAQRLPWFMEMMMIGPPW